MSLRAWLAIRYPASSAILAVSSGPSGQVSMALMTVGSGTLLLGWDWIGLGTAVDADWVLWRLGTARARDRLLDPVPDDDAARDHAGRRVRGLLMPVLPPMAYTRPTSSGRGLIRPEAVLMAIH
jgi:hypothetical protein